MIFKYSKLTIFLLAVLSFGVFAFVSAQVDAPPPKVCGDGNIDNPNDSGIVEQCDDGNHTNGDGCNDATADGCRFVCGDGAVQSPNGNDQYEKCDTANKGYCADNPAKECTEDKDCNGFSDRCIFTCTNECGVKLLGWAWSENFGWLSLNRDNCDHLSPEVLAAGSDYDVTEVCLDHFYPGIDYYVQVKPDIGNSLTGRAWSENVGWVCFGEYCNGEAPVIGWVAMVENYDTQNSPVEGWGKILMTGTDGWISLSCINTADCESIDYGIKLAAEYYSPHGKDDKVLRKTLFGWAWNGSNSGDGFGWINFTPEIKELNPWLETQSGDIYAQKGITTSRPIGSFNATYRILAFGGIEALSAQGESWLDDKYGPIDFPTPKTRYSNILGKLDVDGLICGSAPCLNKYGDSVTNLSALEKAIDEGKPLGGKIYYHNGDVTIGQDGNLTVPGGDIIFKNGSNFEKGSGTIIIDGDLTIKTNVEYDPNDALTKFINLASVAWIVRGDLKISSTVQRLAGNFIILGKSSVASCSSDPAVETPGCGQVYSCYGGSSSTCDDYRLEVSGLMMARKFYFGRTYTDPNEERQLGSELIIYDGRLLAHIPPGLDDFVSALPIWRSGIFSQ